MNENTLCKNICALRKQAGLTQDALAAKLGLTYQAVSKWENGLSCPDVQLLPTLADIFGVSIDSLFGRETPASEIPETPDALVPVAEPVLPWEDDNTIYVVLYHGHRLITDEPFPVNGVKDIPFIYEGPVMNIHSVLSVHVEGDVDGSIFAGGSIDCGNVGGDASTGGDMDCGSVGGDVTAGGNVDCSSVGGNVYAEGDLDCGSVMGNVRSDVQMDAEWQQKINDLNRASAEFAKQKVDEAAARLREASQRAKEKARRQTNSWHYDFGSGTKVEIEIKDTMDDIVNNVEKVLDGIFDKLDFTHSKDKKQDNND